MRTRHRPLLLLALLALSPAFAQAQTEPDDRWGLSAEIGAKSEGFFPGLPMEDGAYIGLGVMGGW